MKDRYYSTNLKNASKIRVYPTVQIPQKPELLVVEERSTGFCGAIIGIEKAPGGLWVKLEDAKGVVRLFPLKPGVFSIDNQPITLIAPAFAGATGNTARKKSNSGSTFVSDHRAKVALPSRIWVEGVHDAAIVEKVWGHDLRVEGIVVEQLAGLDHLAERLQNFPLSPQAKIGVLVDHLLTGTKESRLTAELGPYVMVTGNPFVDIWQGVKPQALGISSWPIIPKGQDWKTGICQQLGWSNPQSGWQKVYGAVNSYKDLEAALLGAVERLIDFITTADS